MDATEALVSETACSLSYYFAAAATEADAEMTETDAAISSGCCSSSPAVDAATDSVSDSAEATTDAAVDEKTKRKISK